MLMYTMIGNGRYGFDQLDYFVSLLLCHHFLSLPSVSYIKPQPALEKAEQPNVATLQDYQIVG